MSTKIKRSVFDFCATDYAKKSRSVEILTSIPVPIPIPSATSTGGDQRSNRNQFIQRGYFSLQGEDAPNISRLPDSHDLAQQPIVYRYDWAFGVVLLAG